MTQPTQTQDTLNIRGIAPQTVQDIKAQARARGITVGEMLGRLMTLYAGCRQSRSVEIDTLLTEANLEPVTY